MSALIIGIASVGEGQCKTTARVQCRRPSAKKVYVEGHMAIYFWFVQLQTNHQWLATCRQYKLHAGLRLLQVWAMHAQTAPTNTRDSVHDFSVKLSLFRVLYCTVEYKIQILMCAMKNRISAVCCLLRAIL